MKPHHWSGWPGGYCLDCLINDPLDYCLAMHDWNIDQDCPKPECQPTHCTAPINRDKCGQCAAMEKKNT